MSYLQLPAAELEATLLKELAQNPALELVDELRCPGCGKRLQQLPCPSCAAPHADGTPVVFLSPREPAAYGAWSRRDGDDPIDAGMPDRLDEYILRQIGPALTREERPLAAYLLAQLDEHGFLQESPAEVAAFRHVSLRQVEIVLALIQRADPPGVAATSPQASLLIQLECLADAERAPQAMIALARCLIQDHFEALGRIEYQQIARRLHLSPDSVEAAARFIQRNLTPYPSRAFWGEGARTVPEADDGAALRSPDINISVLDRESGQALAVEVLAPLSGWLRVSPELKAALATNDCAEEERDKWMQAMAEAALVAKCLQQRNHTMRRLMEIIAESQRGFILGGDGDLRPITRAQIAKTLGLHESTISRAVAGKSVALPDGRLVPLAKFFDRSLWVRDRVRHLIEGETHALTDDEIATALGRQGVYVARRTVAKYRKMLGILPAHVRGRRARAAPSQPAATSGPAPAIHQEPTP